MGYETAFDLKVVWAAAAATKTGEDEGALVLWEAFMTQLRSPEAEAKARLKGLWSEASEKYSGIMGIARAAHTLKDIAETLDYVASGNSAKWYSFREEMARVSAIFPEYRFVVHGRGEDEDDHWLAEFHDGKSKRARYEPPKLEEVAWESWR